MRYIGKQLSHEVLEHYRFRAIELCKSGDKVKDIAHFFGVHPNSVSRWLVAYRKEGKKALKSSKASGPETKLDIEERKLVIKLIRKPATEYGFETPLWTCRRIQQLIKEKTGKELDISNVWRWLISWGMSNQKPERRAYEFDPKEWGRWIKETWPEILEKARKWQAIIYFQDECFVSLIAVLGKTWAPRGKRPVVKVTGNRGGISVSSVISKGGRLFFRTEKRTINYKVFIDFLRQLINHHNHRRIIVIADRARPHIAEEVKRFIEKNSKKIALYYLPPHSSHKNPDENTWGYLKDKKLKAHQAKSVRELSKLVLSKMAGIQKRPHIVRSFFYNSFIT